MLKHIVFFVPCSNYDAIAYFTAQLSEALSNEGVTCETIDLTKRRITDVIAYLRNKKPDCTFTFNPILPLPDGSQLCDILQIPHVTILLDVLANHLFLSDSPYAIVGSIDSYICEILKRRNFTKTFHFPLATRHDLPSPQEDHRCYDVTMLGTCIDCEGIQKTWQEKHTGKLCKAIDSVINATLSDNETSYLEIAMTQLYPFKDIDHHRLYAEILQYLKGYDRIRVVKAIKDADIHIFGTSTDKRGWKYYLDTQNNITLHGPVSYETSLAIMSKSKIVIDSSPGFKKGPHDRILTGLASGAMILTGDTHYIRNNFTENMGITTYDHEKLGILNEKVSALLNDTKTRIHAVSKGREFVKKKHTWKNRCNTMHNILPGLSKS